MNKDNQNKKMFEKRNKVDGRKTQDDTPIDEFKDQQFTDDIPLEELKIKVKQEKDKAKTQDDSQSEEDD